MKSNVHLIDRTPLRVRHTDSDGSASTPDRCGPGGDLNAGKTAIIERYKRRESSVEEALIEMYLAGVSMRRVEDIAETPIAI